MQLRGVYKPPLRSPILGYSVLNNEITGICANRLKGSIRSWGLQGLSSALTMPHSSGNTSAPCGVATVAAICQAMIPLCWVATASYLTVLKSIGILPLIAVGPGFQPWHLRDH